VSAVRSWVIQGAMLTDAVALVGTTDVLLGSVDR
jgi:NADH:ubiquinone oxidoreductase subunit D